MTDGELKIKVDMDHLKPEEQNKQTDMLATESVRSQEVQQSRVSATSAASEGVSCPQTEDLRAIKEKFFLSKIGKFSSNSNICYFYLKLIASIGKTSSLKCFQISLAKIKSVRHN